MSKSTLKYLIYFSVLLYIFFSWNCKIPVSKSYTDVDAIKDYIYSHPSIFLSDLFDTTRNTSFYREITKRDYWISINFHEADSNHFFRNADVYWNDSLGGVFHTFISGTEYLKNFKAFSKVRAYFEQWGDAGDIYRGWLLMKIQNVQIYSTPTHPDGFNTLWVNSSGSDDLINLGSLYDLNKVLKFTRLTTQVKFTIQVTDPSDLYYLHIYEGSDFRKIRFTNDSSNFFTASWTPTSQDFNTYRHAYIDCLDPKSVADTSWKYDSNAWGILYKIKP